MQVLEAQTLYVGVMKPAPSSKQLQLRISQAAREARRAAGDPKLVHIASIADYSEGTLSRFERGETWPRDIDRVLAAYETYLELPPGSLVDQAFGQRDG